MQLPVFSVQISDLGSSLPDVAEEGCVYFQDGSTLWVYVIVFHVCVYVCVCVDRVGERVRV